MARPWKRPFLNPRQPVRVLTWSMQKARIVHGWTGKQTAQAYGCSESRITRVEQGTMPSRSLVIFYEETFETDGQLLSLYEVAIEGDEQDRRRYGGKRPPSSLPPPTAKGMAMKASMLDERTRRLTADENAARRTARAIADPDVQATTDGKLVKTQQQRAPVVLSQAPKAITD